MWYCKACGDASGAKSIVSVQPIESCPDCGGSVEQDPDTLDTWFGVGQWTWSTLVDPEAAADPELSLKEILERSPDYQHFHPTQVLETGYDILFFWVARMILMTTFSTGQIPFETVYLHGLIRTRDGKKMSKSDPSTCVDPLEVIPEFGADALRLSMIVGQSPGKDSRLYDEKIAGYRNFINKLWNASRFVLMQCSDAGVTPGAVQFDASNVELSLADRALLSALQELVDDTTKGLADYRLSEVGEKLYSFVWDYFCDWYLELSKGESNPEVLVHTMRTILTLLHPYCPFVTEELWSQFAPEGADMLMKQPWPEADDALRDAEYEQHFQRLIDVISAVRSIRADYDIEAGKQIAVVLHTKEWVPLLETQEAHIRKLARIESLTIETEQKQYDHAASAFLNGIDVHVPLEGIIDLEEERIKLEGEREKLSGYVSGLEKKLGDSKFVDNAPEEVVEGEREKLASNQEKLAKVEERIKALK